MPITENPFGVGASGYDVVTRSVRCSCCDLPFSYQAPSTSPIRRAVCDHCPAHLAQEGETVEDENRRLRDHEPRLVAEIDKVRVFAQEAHRVRERSREQVAAALQSRDRAEQRLEEFADEHVEQTNGRCSWRRT